MGNTSSSKMNRGAKKGKATAEPDSHPTLPPQSTQLTQTFEHRAYDYTTLQRVWQQYGEKIYAEQQTALGIPRENQTQIEFPVRHVETITEYLRELKSKKPSLRKRVMIPLFEEDNDWTVLSVLINGASSVTLPYFIDPVGRTHQHNIRLQALAAEIKSAYPGFTETIQRFSPHIHHHPDVSGPLCLENMICLALETGDNDSRHLGHKSAVPRRPSTPPKRCSESDLQVFCLRQYAALDQLKTTTTDPQAPTSSSQSTHTPDLNAKNPYDVLGLNSHAEESDINAAFRHLARIHHPDKGGREEDFKKINEAYNRLSDPKQRGLFDEAWRLFHTEETTTPTARFSTPFRRVFYESYQQFLRRPARKMPTNPPTSRPTPFHYTLLTKPPPLPAVPIIPFYLRSNLGVDDSYAGNLTLSILIAFAAMAPYLLLSLMKIISEPTKYTVALEKDLENSFIPYSSIPFLLISLVLAYSLHQKSISWEQKVTAAKIKQTKHREKYPSQETIQAHFDNPFAYATAKSKQKDPDSTTLLAFTIRPNTVIKLLIRFLNGQLYGDVLEKTVDDLTKQCTASARDTDNLLTQPLYQAVIHLLSLKDLPEDNTTLLTSLKTITEYAQNTAESSIAFLVPLFQNKAYQSLFMTALHQYWQPNANNIQPSIRQAYDGQQAAEQLINTIKKNITLQGNSGAIDPDTQNTIQYARNMQQFEKEAQAALPPLQQAAFYRDQAYQLLNWIPLIREHGNNRMLINTLLQSGIYFQNAAIATQRPARKMAYETLAHQIYMNAFYTARQQTPDIECYTLTHSLRYLSAFQFESDAIKQTRGHLRERAIYLNTMFPFFETIRSNIYWLQPTFPPLAFRRQYLHHLLDRLPADHTIAGQLKKNPERSAALYQAYEACLKGWYEQPHNPAIEQQLRTALMDQLLADHGWNNHQLTQNISYPAIMVAQDPERWPQMDLAIPFPRPITQFFKAVHGFTIHHKTGVISVLYDPWQPGNDQHEKRLTPHDVKQMLTHGIDHAIFSLDPVEAQQPFHPFNTLRYYPPSLHQTEFLNTLFLADYLLKFLTVGYVVQGKPPYALRPTEEVILSRLPPHLLKIIEDFRDARDDQPSNESSVHRFWIEATHLDAAIKYHDGVQQVAIGNIKMVVKKHQMVRNDAGDLIDADELKEGWDYYVLKSIQWQPWLTEHLRITAPSLVFIRDESAFYHIDQGQVSERCSVSPDNIYVGLLHQLRDKDEKVIVSPDNKTLLYQITRKVAEALKLPHHYSPESIFARQFTEHYDDFARYFPELGRLTAFCRMTLLASNLTGTREANEKSTKKIEPLLSPHHPHWQQYGNEKNRIQRQYQQNYDKDTQEQREALKKQFQDIKSRIHETYLFGCEPSSIFEQIQQSFPFTVNVADVNAAILQDSTDALERILNALMTFRFSSASSQRYDTLNQIDTMHQKEKTQLTQQQRANEQLEKHFTALGLNTQKDHHPPDTTCPWVPAAVWHSNSLWGEQQRSRLVYGGVCVTPKVNDLSGTAAGQQLLAHAVMNSRSLPLSQLASCSQNPSTLRAQNPLVHTAKRRSARATPAGSNGGAATSRKGGGPGSGAAAGGDGGDKPPPTGHQARNDGCFGGQGGKSALRNVQFKHWQRGDAIDKSMPDGAPPTWDTVRSRYWKNRGEAAKQNNEFIKDDLKRMNKGLAPQDYNPRTMQWESRELHHVNPQRNSGENNPINLRELTPDWHAEVDPFRQVPGISTNRGIL